MPTAANTNVHHGLKLFFYRRQFRASLYRLDLAPCEWADDIGRAPDTGGSLVSTVKTTTQEALNPTSKLKMQVSGVLSTHHISAITLSGDMKFLPIWVIDALVRHCEIKAAEVYINGDTTPAAEQPMAKYQKLKQLFGATTQIELHVDSSVDNDTIRAEALHFARHARKLIISNEFLLGLPESVLQSFAQIAIQLECISIDTGFRNQESRYSLASWPTIFIAFSQLQTLHFRGFDHLGEEFRPDEEEYTFHPTTMQCLTEAYTRSGSITKVTGLVPSNQATFDPLHELHCDALRAQLMLEIRNIYLLRRMPTIILSNDNLSVIAQCLCSLFTHRESKEVRRRAPSHRDLRHRLLFNRRAAAQTVPAQGDEPVPAALGGGGAPAQDILDAQAAGAGGGGGGGGASAAASGGR